MERSLRNRLTFGPIMLAGLFLLLWLDHSAQRWTLGAYHHHGQPQGVAGIGIVLMFMVILPVAILELAQLFTAERVRPYRMLSAVGAGLLIVHAFATQFPRFQPIAASTLAFIVVFVMLGAALLRALTKQTHDAIVRMAGTVLATLYLGGLAWFIVALRVKGAEHVH